MAAVEDRHWWFVARRKVLGSVLRSIGLQQPCRLCEVGAGTGGNLRMLAAFAEVDAFELDDYAREMACQRSGVAVQRGALPDHLPNAAGPYNVVCMFDVLEHIERDDAALLSVRSIMSEGGRLVITVPAYQWLWSAHDEQLHHKRRYTSSSLAALIRGSGLQIELLTYFNTLLFPLGAAGRVLDRIGNRTVLTGNSIPSKPINAALTGIFSSERWLLRVLNFPFGMSLLAVARKGRERPTLQ